MHEEIWAWISVFVLHCWSGLSQHVIPANCNEDISLPCNVSHSGSIYRYMVWYRNDTPIIKRKVNIVTFYNRSSPASLGVQDTLVLQNVQPSDTGNYQCFLAADIGQKDMQSFVSLRVSDCVTVSPTWPTSRQMCILNIVEVSFLWSLLGFSLISLFKIICCILIVMVCKKHRGNEKRSRSGRWRQRNSYEDTDKVLF